MGAALDDLGQESLDPRQIAIWRAMTSDQKLRLAFELYDLAKNSLWQHLRAAHPELSDEEVEALVRERFAKRE